MTNKLNTALQNIEMTYQEVVEIANNMTNPIFVSVNELVQEIEVKLTTLSIDHLRDYMLRLQLKAFELSDIKEKSAFKAEMAEVLQKEAFAVKFNSYEGSATVKEKLATIAASEEIVSKTLYELIANLFKTKLDQLHRLIDCLKSILMSRMQETKFMNIGTSDYIPPTTNGRVTLNE